MPTTALVQKKKTSVSALFSYPALRRKVKERMLLGQKRIEEEKVSTYGDIGRMINEHVIEHGGRAEHGKRVVERLEKDLEISRKVLYKMRQFAEDFPNVSAWRHLTWSHFRALLTIEDKRYQKTLANLADRNRWDTGELEEEIQKWKHSRSGNGHLIETGPVALPIPSLGTLYTYRIFQPKSIDVNVKMPLKVDLGFQVYLDLALLRFPGGLKEGDIVRAKPELVGARSPRPLEGRGNPAPTIIKEGTTADLFTYRAAVEDVTDGDTLRVHIDFGLGMSTRQYLRLTHINGPELKTKEGQAAREFVLREIRRSPIVKLRSTKHDLFDRYLADVFLEDGTYLNQRILDAGHAIRILLDTTK